VMRRKKGSRVAEPSPACYGQLNTHTHYTGDFYDVCSDYNIRYAPTFS